MPDEELMGPGAGDLSLVLDQLRQAGQTPDRTLLDRVKAHGQAAVRPLIELAVDEQLHTADSESPLIWAPLHAIELLGELGAPEAVAPLLSLLDRADDDYLHQSLEEGFGGIGAPAVPPLRALLFDRAGHFWARVRAAECLAQIGQRHPETRSEVVSALVARLNPAESQSPEDEILNGFAISALADLKAVEAVSAIRQAFGENRVDTSIVNLGDVLAALGLPAAPRPAQQAGLKLRLHCTACRYEREHHLETVYCDLGTQERREKGEPTPYSEFVIAQRITCPKCGALDQYELSGLAHFTLTAELLKKMAAHERGEPGGEPDTGPLRLIRFGLADGRDMHPYEAREWYRRKVEAEPNSADLRVRYANVLRFLDYRQEAIEQYQAALRLEASNLEAYLNLGRLAQAAGDELQARQMFERLITETPRSRVSRKDREAYIEAAVEGLADLALLRAAAVAGARGPGLALPRPTTPAARKVGRNDACPCGSGKKYKKCHGR